ncbi:MAG: SDR family NAD(P)-dependent oxidoreductase [Hyphomicrobiaceae bacterium]|nr:SDR family NAD(P)-dependent oxidoreductase [Hyphomicrobiaceae bacterium]
MTANARKTALVTGASSGFGEAIATRMVGQGHKVVLAARRMDRLKGLERGLGADMAHAVAMDVTDRRAVAHAVDALPAAFASIDILVNNAGLALGLAPAQDADADDWDRMIETNCRGVVNVTHAVLPGMVARGEGHVINIGSVAGTYPYVGGNIYGASKAFVRQFSLNLRSDLHGTGLRVTSIEPGLCGGTEFSSIRFKGEEERAASMYKGLDPILPEDIAEAVYWAASQPAHVNVNAIEVMPVAQSFAPLQVHRRDNSI